MGVANRVLFCLIIGMLVIVVLFTSCKTPVRPLETTAKTTVPDPNTSTAPSTSTTVLVPATEPTTTKTVPLTTSTASSIITNEAKLGIRTTKAIGERNFVSVLVNFPDVKRTVSENFIRERMTSAVVNYFAEVSYNKLVLNGKATKIYKLPNPVSSYRISPYNLEVDPERVISLVNDSVNVADADVNFDRLTMSGSEHI